MSPSLGRILQRHASQWPSQGLTWGARNLPRWGEHLIHPEPGATGILQMFLRESGTSQPPRPSASVAAKVESTGDLLKPVSSAGNSDFSVEFYFIKQLAEGVWQVRQRKQPQVWVTGQSWEKFFIFRHG